MKSDVRAQRILYKVGWRNHDILQHEHLIFCEFFLVKRPEVLVRPPKIGKDLLNGRLDDGVAIVLVAGQRQEDVGQEVRNVVRVGEDDRGQPEHARVPGLRRLALLLQRGLCPRAELGDQPLRGPPVRDADEPGDRLLMIVIGRNQTGA